ncbi:Trm112 family protein [soil metagenome]
MAIDSELLAILVCPQDRGDLIHVEGEFFYNPRLRRAYPIRNDIPVMLIDEARDVDEAEHLAIVAAHA